ncbi:MAG: DUF2341 domain-containing protein [Candidatus Thorarchaeota archaeon]
MKKNRLNRRKIISTTLLFILMISSFEAIFFSNNFTFKEEFEENKEINIDSLLNAQIGEDPWWNSSFQWRQCINISNPGTYNLEDNIIKIQFNWKNLYDAGHIQADLDDVRIVENNELRNYYIKKDFPNENFATVWFEVNSTAGTTDYDTYLYYGNNTVGVASNYYLDHCPDGIARWEFEEGSGDTVYDSMSNLYHGTMFNMEDVDFVATPELQGDYAISMDGVNEYIALNMSFNYQGVDEYQLTTLSGPIYQFTASAWVKLNLNQGGWSILDFDRSEYFTFAAGQPGYIATDGHVEFDSTEDTGGIDDFLGITLIDEDVPAQWHHCVVKFDYSQQFDKKIYVDGVLDNQKDAWNGLPIGDISETRFGFIGDGSEATSFDGGRNGQYFEGLLDDVRYFDYALTDNEIEWLANYYPLDIALFDEVERAATVTIIIKDEDNRLVPGAEVSLWENKTHILTVDSTKYTKFTVSDGSVEFSKVPFGFYNITVNYTLYNGLDEKEVYDSRKIPGGEVEFKGLYVSTNITVNLWTINFEVDDFDGDPLNYGYIDVGNSSIYIIDSIPLDSNGQATFRWLSSSSYNYTVYYNNPDYYSYPTPLNSSTVTNLAPQQIYFEQIVTNMSKLEIRVMDETGTEGVTGVAVKVQLNNTKQVVVELETNKEGYAIGDYTTDFGFWYLTEQVYNFTLWIIGQKQSFKVNTSDKYKPVLTDYYNYTLDKASSLVFYLDGLNFTKRIANFSIITGDISVVWGENMSFSVVYETSDDSGQTWLPDWNRLGFDTEATWTIYSKYGVKLLTQSMDRGSTTGSYIFSINSSFFSAGDEYEFYYVLISGYKPFWNDPVDAYFGITLYAKPASITLHDYTSMPDELPKNIAGKYEISEYYGCSINITAKYFDISNNLSLIPESFIFNWDYGSGSLILGPSPGFYTFEIDTSDAANVGKYRIDISVNLENYTEIEDFGMYINILSRPTEINGSSGIFYVSEDIYIFKAKNFSFNYIDTFTSSPISNLDEKSYLLQRIDQEGNPIPGTTETGSLFQVGSEFVLDLHTELREDGKYSIVVTLEKLNYDHRIAIISLTIMKRLFYIQNLQDYIEIPSGAPLDFTISVIDPNNETNPNAPVIGANVYLIIQGKNITFNDNGDGSYSITPTIIAEAFFMPQTFTATLYIEKQYFSISTESITIVVKMQEIFGFPFFYFLMIAGSIIAVLGSLIAYRIIQQARIPTFVKKARSIKKNIKGSKSISQSLLYPTKEEFIVKKLGKKWELMGLSLGDLMSIKEKKKNRLSELKEEFEGGVD